MEEPLYTSFEGLIDDMLEKTVPQIRSGPYCLFGHSLGGKIAFELSQKIQSSSLPGPAHIFISGRRAPFTRPGPQRYRDLSEMEFVEHVKQLGGTPPQLFESPELLQIFLPILRHDFIFSEHEAPRNEYGVLKYDITTIFGTEEPLSTNQIDDWAKYTSGSHSKYFLDGGHFFINEKAFEILSLIKSTLGINSTTSITR